MSTQFSTKQAAREYVWNALVAENAAAFPFPVSGRIPNFVGAQLAADKLLSHSIWNQVRRVKCNPDSPQRPLRVELLRRGISYVFPTPRLKGGFYLFDPSKIPADKYREAATLNTCMQWGQPLSLQELPPIDLVVTGSVAVTCKGLRCGKGHGYGDLEYAIYTELGHPAVPVVTSVHDLQCVDSFPPAKHDLPVSIIATPTRIIEIESPPLSPSGLHWDLLDGKDLDEMPILRELKYRLQIK